MSQHPSADLDALERRLVQATQAGLPLVAEPYEAVAREVGCDAEAAIRRLRGMLDRGVIRRIGAVPNHYAIGYAANGMSVWDVDDDAVDELGQRVGALPFVTHCYRRPRCAPNWPYNLFAMLHASTQDAVRGQAAEVAAILGTHLRAHDILFSSRILKKTGLRIAG